MNFQSMKREKMLVSAESSMIRKFGLVGLTLCLSLMFGGCAQQADVVRMNRDLNKKIAKLDKSKIELQQSIDEANNALKEANSIIAQQRQEINCCFKPGPILTIK